MADTFPLPASMPLPSDSFWSRLCHTSLFDALRGKVEGLLDARRVIASFQLGEMLSSVVWDVVQRTRLWRSEKVDVARELASHFREGLDSGRSAEELLADFGERPMVVKLIRRAKLRSRAWALPRLPVDLERSYCCFPSAGPYLWPACMVVALREGGYSPKHLCGDRVASAKGSA